MIEDVRARVALPSRIFVEGRHEAELVEKVWGDDLRLEGDHLVAGRRRVGLRRRTSRERGSDSLHGSQFLRSRADALGRVEQLIDFVTTETHTWPDAAVGWAHGL